MENLILHPSCTPGAIHTITACVTPTATGCRAVFDAVGDMAALLIPPRCAPGRYEDLWKTTCFEVFWQANEDGDEGPYREFNLSPSTRWANYDFDAFRQGSRHGPAEVAISVSLSDTMLHLEAEITAELPLPAQIALNAVIEDKDGTIGYWALAFPAGKPEFHSQMNRVLRVGAL